MITCNQYGMTFFLAGYQLVPELCLLNHVSFYVFVYNPKLISLSYGLLLPIGISTLFLYLLF